MINAFIALESPVAVQPETFLEWCKAHLFHREWTVGDAGQVDGSLALTSDGLNVMVMPMGVAVPGNDAIENPHISPFWKGDRERFRRHAAHWIVVVFGDEPPMAEAQELSRILVMLSSQIKEVSGICWGPTTMWIDPAEFEKLTNDPELIGRIPAWVSVHAGDMNGQVSGYSSGLDALGFMDIEVFGFNGPAVELMGWIYDLATYIVDRGQVINHGETVGQTAEERIPVRHARSSFDRKQTVMRIECTPQKKWWKFWE